MPVFVIGSASDGPPPGPADHVSGWVQVASHSGVSLRDDDTVDLDTGTTGHYDSATNKPEMDIILHQDTTRLTAINDPTQMALLTTPGDHNPTHCTATTTVFDDNIGNAHNLAVGQDLCVATNQYRAAILTIDQPPSTIRPVLTFHYTLWEQRGPAPPGPQPPVGVSATSAPRPPNPVSGWVQVASHSGVSLRDDDTVDLDTGTTGHYDSATNKPEMDIILHQGTTRLTAINDPTQMALLTSSGDHNPTHCTATTTVFDDNIGNVHNFTVGQDLCVATNQYRAAILTIDQPPSTIRPVLTFHYTLWENR